MIDYSVLIDCETETETLYDILGFTEIEVHTQIDYDIDEGHYGSRNYPEEPARADIISVKILDFSFAPYDEIKCLLTSEQIEEIKQITNFIIQRDWKNKIQNYALEKEVF